MSKSRPQAAKHPPLVHGGSIEPLGDPIRVRGKLALLGWPSMRAWATAHGYRDEMANYTVRTWGNRTDKEPHGGVARALMCDLRRTLDEGIRPPVGTDNEGRVAIARAESHVGERVTHIIGDESVASFARRSGVQESTLRAYIKRGVKPGLDHLVAISRAGGVTLDWLAVGEEKRAEG